MIKLVYGPKGFGKTKIIKDNVNAAAKDAKGNVVFITDEKLYSVDIDLNVKCVFTEEYDVKSVAAFDGFVKGLIAGNNDIESIFIDGIKRITDEADLAKYEAFFAGLKDVAEKNDVDVILTVSADKDELPKFMLDYIA